MSPSSSNSETVSTKKKASSSKSVVPVRGLSHGLEMCDTVENCADFVVDLFRILEWNMAM